MRMNPDRHRAAFRRLYDDIVAGNDARALATKAFYDEYFAVLDLTAEFYLETVATIFRDHLLARGEFEWRGRRVDPGAIRRTPLLTVEGSATTSAASARPRPRTTSAPASRCRAGASTCRPGAGHFGVFSGSRWELEVYPELRSHILMAR